MQMLHHKPQSWLIRNRSNSVHAALTGGAWNSEKDPEVDSFLWPASRSSSYTASSTCRWLCQGSIRFAPMNCIWKSGAPLECKVFLWLAVQHRVWTSDRWHRYGLQDSMSACFTCLQGEDTIVHVLVPRVNTREVLYGCLWAAGVSTAAPVVTDSIEDWWPRSHVLFNRRSKIPWHVFQQIAGRSRGELACWMSSVYGVGQVKEGATLQRESSR